MTRPHRVGPGPGQESVWDYPRPPRLEASLAHIVVMLNGGAIASTTRSLRILETSHPPVHYIPFADVAMGLLRTTSRHSWCEWKGQADYWALATGGHDLGWSYPRPSKGFEPLADHLAFYPSGVDGITLDGEGVTTQAGGFYGGWITSRVVGPFKGEPGTSGW